MPAPTTLNQKLELLERQLIVGALLVTQNNKAEAARRLGLKRTTLIEKMRRLGMPLNSDATNGSVAEEGRLFGLE